MKNSLFYNFFLFLRLARRIAFLIFKIINKCYIQCDIFLFKNQKILIKIIDNIKYFLIAVFVINQILGVFYPNCIQQLYLTIFNWFLFLWIIFSWFFVGHIKQLVVNFFSTYLITAAIRSYYYGRNEYFWYDDSYVLHHNYKFILNNLRKIN